jgi:hypothetical protein
MNVRFSSLLAFVGIFLFTSCNKEFSDVDASLLPTDTFVIEKQTALVGVQHERIEVIRTDEIYLFFISRSIPRSRFWNNNGKRYNTAEFTSFIIRNIWSNER